MVSLIQGRYFMKMVGDDGIEPPTPPACKADALPAELIARDMVTRRGIEPLYRRERAVS